MRAAVSLLTLAFFAPVAAGLHLERIRHPARGAAAAGRRRRPRCAASRCTSSRTSGRGAPTRSRPTAPNWQQQAPAWPQPAAAPGGAAADTRRRYGGNVDIDLGGNVYVVRRRAAGAGPSRALAGAARRSRSVGATASAGNWQGSPPERRQRHGHLARHAARPRWRLARQPPSGGGRRQLRRQRHRTAAAAAAAATAARRWSSSPSCWPRSPS